MQLYDSVSPKIATGIVNNWIFNLLFSFFVRLLSSNYFLIRWNENRQGWQVRLGKSKCCRRLGWNYGWTDKTWIWHCNCINDHNIGTWASCWFQQTIHVTWHLHHDQKAGSTETQLFQLSTSVIEGDLGKINFALHLYSCLVDVKVLINLRVMKRKFMEITLHHIRLNYRKSC